MFRLLLGFLLIGGPQFRDVAPEAGVKFTLQNSPTPRKLMVETMAGGLAAFDYDNDGLADLFFTNGATLPGLDKSDPKYWNRLYHNEGNWHFKDVTEAAGLKGDGYSMAAAAADFDNDGRVDLFVAGYRANRLYRNRGNGTFEDVTAKSGIAGTEWAVGAGWFDFDNDGLLDLFVVNYADWSLDFDRFCGDSAKGIRVYCHPQYLTPIANRLYRNRGDGTFEDVSVKSGIAAHKGRGMGVAFAGRDLFVTNDKLPNFYFRNNGKGHFEEDGLLTGVALLDHGKAVSSMGADYRDYDNDGRPDIAMTALEGETFPLFHNIGSGFEDATARSGMARASNPRTGWGIGLVDFDNDGWKDLFAACAHVNDLVELTEPAHYKQPNILIRNLGGGKFGTSGIDIGEARAHRGAVFADFDNDGRIDIAISVLGGPAEVWRNESPDAGHWLAIKLEGTRSNRDAIGAEIRLGSQRNDMTTAGGYASSIHAPVHFGLGSQTNVPHIEIKWPSGATQSLENVKADQVLKIKEP
ncbi:MAG: CRTAC1 family protein [Bryobacteraceae bacterium]